MGVAARMGILPEFVERRTRRRGVKIDGRLRELGKYGQPATVHNLSADGFMAESEGYFPLSCYVWLQLPGNVGLNARVIWHEGGRYGCAFVAPVDQRVIDRFAE